MPPREHSAKREIAVTRARVMRRDATSAEASIWRLLRNRNIGGYKFTRQTPIDGYIVDFVCRDQKLVVEIDGATHSADAERAYDGARTRVLEASGYRVLRMTNAEVFENLDAAAETILAALERRL